MNQNKIVRVQEITPEPVYEVFEDSCIADHEMTDESGIECTLEPLRYDDASQISRNDRQQSFDYSLKNKIDFENIPKNVSV